MLDLSSRHSTMTTVRGPFLYRNSDLCVSLFIKLDSFSILSEKVVPSLHANYFDGNTFSDNKRPKIVIPCIYCIESLSVFTHCYRSPTSFREYKWCRFSGKDDNPYLSLRLISFSMHLPPDSHIIPLSLSSSIDRLGLIKSYFSFLSDHNFSFFIYFEDLWMKHLSTSVEFRLKSSRHLTINRVVMLLLANCSFKGSTFAQKLLKLLQHFHDPFSKKEKNSARKKRLLSKNCVLYAFFFTFLFEVHHH